MSKEKILDAAEQLFVEKGFDGTSVRELAQAAGVNIAMISYYFGCKEKLLESLVEQKAGYTLMKLEEFNQQQELSPVEKLDHIVDYYVELIFNNRKFHHMMYRELTLQQRKDLHERIMDIFSRNWDEFGKALMEGQHSGIFKEEVDVELVIMTVFGLINQCSQSEITLKLTHGVSPDKEGIIKTRLKNHLKNILHDHLIANE